jgi:hypothetical protein
MLQCELVVEESSINRASGQFGSGYYGLCWNPTEHLKHPFSWTPELAGLTNEILFHPQQTGPIA